MPETSSRSRGFLLGHRILAVTQAMLRFPGPEIIRRPPLPEHQIFSRPASYCSGRKQGFLRERELGGIPGPILRIEIKQIYRRDEVSRIRDKNLSESGQTQSSYAEIFSERPTSNSRTSWRRAPNGSRSSTILIVHFHKKGSLKMARAHA